MGPSGGRKSSKGNYPFQGGRSVVLPSAPCKRKPDAASRRGLVAGSGVWWWALALVLRLAMPF
jgi:hypothetical protein